jgi:hypothetical protein
MTEDQITENKHLNEALQALLAADTNDLENGTGYYILAMNSQTTKNFMVARLSTHQLCYMVFLLKEQITRLEQKLKESVTSQEW